MGLVKLVRRAKCPIQKFLDRVPRVRYMDPMTASTHPPITVRNIITFVDDVALATSVELATWFGVDVRFVDTMVSEARLVDGGGGTWTVPGDDYRDHLDLMETRLDLDAEIKVQPSKGTTAPAKKLAPPKHPKPPKADPVATLPPVEYVQLFPEDSTPEQRAHAFGGSVVQVAPEPTPKRAERSTPRVKAQPDGQTWEVVPGGTEKMPYTARDPQRPGVVTHHGPNPILKTPATMPTYKWAHREGDNDHVCAVSAVVLAELEAIILAGGPDVAYYEKYYSGYKRVDRARKSKKGKAG